MPTLYSSKPNLVLGFHGCDKVIADAVINNGTPMKPSKNDYDWLGHGIYFWENNFERAWDWAVEQSRRPNSKIKTPAVIGAVIDLGCCLDLLDNHYLGELKQAYKTLKDISQQTGTELPQNKSGHNTTDLLLRKLDCAVVMTAHQLNEIANEKPYDSVRGAFWEGARLYPNAGFAEKNHIQICICNPNCIKGFFHPRDIVPEFDVP